MRRKPIVHLFLIMLLCLVSSTALAYSVDDAEGTVVRVYVEWSCEAERVASEEEGLLFDIPAQSGSWVGSAFAVGKPDEPVQYFVTNRHVVEPVATVDVDVYSLTTKEYMDSGSVDDWPVSKITYYLVFENIDTMVTARHVATSDRADLAVLSPDIPTRKRTASILRPFDLNTMKKVNIYALGFPAVADGSLTKEAREKLDSTQVFRSNGVISTFLSHEKTADGEQIQMTTPINGGNSGGPVVDEDGYVLGVSTSKWSSAQNVNMAVTVNEVIRMLDAAEIPYTTVADLSPAAAESTAVAEATPTPAPIAAVTDTPTAQPTVEPTAEPAPQPTDFNWLLVVLGVLGIATVVLATFAFLKKTSGRKPKPAKDPKPSNQARPPVSNRPSPDRMPPQTAVTRTLIGENGALAGMQFILTDRAVIGRDPHLCQIVFPADTRGVSHAHCTVAISNGVVTVTDNSSRCGTWVDDERLVPGVSVVLHRGHRIYLGSHEQSFVLRS